MSDNKKYYYMRLREDFFDSDELLVLESLPDGHLYSNILLKLYLRSLHGNGRLMFNDAIPYNAQMIATITRHQVGTVERALKTFLEMGLIEILDSGAIYMMNIQNYIGSSSTEADRIRAYRDRIRQEKNSVSQLMYKCNNKRTPEIELDLDTEKNIYMRTVASDGDAREDEKEDFKEQRLPVETAGGTSGSALVSHATTLEGQKAGASETLGVKTAHGAAHKASANQSKTLPGFETFYRAYPKKKGRANALKAWKKLCPDEKTLDEILRALDWQKNSDEWRRDGGQYIPYPASWLNGRRWEDEPDKAGKESGKRWRQFE